MAELANAKVVKTNGKESKFFAFIFCPQFLKSPLDAWQDLQKLKHEGSKIFAAPHAWYKQGQPILIYLDDE
jgi:hypothetical protein